MGVSVIDIVLFLKLIFLLLGLIEFGGMVFISEYNTTTSSSFIMGGVSSIFKFSFVEISQLWFTTDVSVTEIHGTFINEVKSFITAEFSFISSHWRLFSFGFL